MPPFTIRYITFCYQPSFDSSSRNQANLVSEKAHWTCVKFAFSPTLSFEDRDQKLFLFLSFSLKGRWWRFSGTSIKFRAEERARNQERYIYIYILESFYHFIRAPRNGGPRVEALGGGWKGEGRWKRRVPRKMLEDIKLFRC